MYESQQELEKLFKLQLQKIQEDIGRVDLDLLEKHLKLNVQLRKNVQNLVQQLLDNTSPSVKLFKIFVELLPRYLPALERKAKNSYPSVYFSYLMEYQKVEEAFEWASKPSFSKSYPGQVEDFFKKHKRKYPSEATVFFIERLTYYLSESNSSFYYQVAETLEQIAEYNANLAKRWIKTIRENHKRRTNLIKILNQKNLN